jgi:hypothetical protein
VWLSDSNADGRWMHVADALHGRPEVHTSTSSSNRTAHAGARADRAARYLLETVDDLPTFTSCMISFSFDLPYHPLYFTISV